MLKRIVKLVAITFMIFVISFLSNNLNYADYMKEDTNWKVVITSDTKEINDTQEIKFEVEENPNVVNGKMAPGLKATACIEINFIEATGLADIKAVVDKSALYDCFKITARLNGEEYDLNSIKTIDVNDNNKCQKLLLELEWLENSSEIDTMIGSKIESIRVPITINVSQHV